MLALRALANVFVPFVGKATMQSETRDVLASLKKRGGKAALNKNGKVAFATVLLKCVSPSLSLSLSSRLEYTPTGLTPPCPCSFSVLAAQKQLDAKAAEDLAELAVEVRPHPLHLSSMSTSLTHSCTQLMNDSDSETVYRSMMALGNLVRPPLAQYLSSSPALTLGSSCAQLVSFETAAALSASATQRYKAAARDAAQRLPEGRIKSLSRELA